MTMLVGARRGLLLGLKDEGEETFAAKVAAAKTRPALGIFDYVSRFLRFLEKI